MFDPIPKFRNRDRSAIDHVRGPTRQAARVENQVVQRFIAIGGIAIIRCTVIINEHEILYTTLARITKCITENHINRRDHVEQISPGATVICGTCRTLEDPDDSLLEINDRLSCKALVGTALE